MFFFVIFMQITVFNTTSNSTQFLKKIYINVSTMLLYLHFLFYSNNISGVVHAVSHEKVTSLPIPHLDHLCWPHDTVHHPHRYHVTIALYFYERWVLSHIFRRNILSRERDAYFFHRLLHCQLVSDSKKRLSQHQYQRTFWNNTLFRFSSERPGDFI